MASLPPTLPNDSSSPLASSSLSENQVGAGDGRVPPRSSSSFTSRIFSAFSSLRSREIHIPDTLQEFFSSKSSMKFKVLVSALKKQDAEGKTPVHELLADADKVKAFDEFLMNLIGSGQDITPILNSLAQALKIQNDYGLTPVHYMAADADRIKAFGEFLMNLIGSGQDITPILNSLAQALRIQENMGGTPICFFLEKEDKIKDFGKFLVNLIGSGQDITAIIDSFTVTLKIQGQEEEIPNYRGFERKDKNKIFKVLFQAMIEVANAQQDRLLVIWISTILQQIIDDPDFPREFRQDLYESMFSILNPLLTSSLSQNLQNLENIAGYTGIPVEILDLIASSTPSLSFPEEEDSKQEPA